MGFFCDVVAGAAGQGALRPCIECTRGELHHVSSMLTPLSRRQEIGREKEIYRRTDHWLPAGSGIWTACVIGATAHGHRVCVASWVPMQALPKQSRPVACLGLSWCCAAQPLSEMSARLMLAGRAPLTAACAQGRQCLQSCLDPFVLPWSPYRVVRVPLSEMPTIRQKRGASMDSVKGRMLLN